MTVFVLLSALVTRAASAQSAAPTAAAEPVAPVQSPAAPIEAAHPSATASEPEALRAPFVAPGATEIAWQELHAIQARQVELSERPYPSMALPAVGIGLGLPAFAVMVPIGGILVAMANDGSAGDSPAVGVGLIILGIAGFIAFVSGSAVVARRRQERFAQNAEMRSLHDRRTLLERVLEAEWRASRTGSAP